jgi:ribosome maturation factor RimP
VPDLAKTSEVKAAQVESLIGPSLTDMGYDIVRVVLSGDRRAKLQIMVERHDGAGMTVDDCAGISRAVAAILDVSDPIAGAYVLEVSSPGLDRPLTRLGDFARFAGFEARVETRMPVEGQRRFRGRLLGLDGARVQLATDKGEITIDFADVAKAKLILTDELIAAGSEPRSS